MPSSFEALVIDGCGDPLTGGAVRIYFSSEGASVSMEHISDGRWLGSWTPYAAAERISGEIQAVSADGASTQVPIFGSVIASPRP